jgi:mRNA interferase MazF
MILDRGDLVWVNLSPHQGHEQAGWRPSVVISPAKYNEISNCILVCPITTNKGDWAWKVFLPADGHITGAVLVDQIKSLDVRARGVKPSGQRVYSQLMDEILARLATLTG